MSQVLNCPRGTMIADLDWSSRTAQDMYSRIAQENSILPVIYSGLEISVVSGLDITISAGSARGVNILLPGISNLVPSFVELPETNFTLPASSVGYLVLQINALENTINNTWDVEVSSQSASMDFTPVFIPTLPTPNISSYPYAIVVLAYISTNTTGITVLDTSYTSNHRSYDMNVVFHPEFNTDVTTTPQSWYFKDPITGIVTQGGSQTFTSPSTGKFLLPIPLSSYITYNINETSSTAVATYCELVSIDNTGINYAWHGNISESQVVTWFAMGYAEP